MAFVDHVHHEAITAGEFERRHFHDRVEDFARLEEVGAELRSHMAFLNPTSAPDGWASGETAKAEVQPGEGVA